MTRSLTKNIAASTLAIAVTLSSITTTFAAAGPLTNQAIANAAYPIPDAPGGTVQLKNGKFDDPANHYSVDLVPPQDKGDLNADGAEDAAVHLVVSTGGSGVFSYLSAVLNDNGAAKPLPAVFLGDRIAVRSIRINREGEISVLLLERRFDQPMSARPTIPVVRRFKVAGDQLIAISPLSASELNNATYPLESAKGGMATFARGTYEDTEAQVKAILEPSPRSNGDLNGDGSPDTAVPMIVNSGGSGVFSYVSAVLNNGGFAKPVDTVFIGDRVILSNMSVISGVLTVNYLGRKPEEPMAAKPTVPMTKTFTLQNDKLVEAGAAALPEPVPATPIQVVDFTCADNVTFTVVFAGEVATVTFNGQTQELKQQPSGSGIIYANENWQLQGKGDQATLTDLKSNTVVAKDCTGKAYQAIVPAGPAPLPPATAPTATTTTTSTNVITPALSLSGKLTGEVYYMQRIALPENAKVTVRLLQVLPDVAPAIASQTIDTNGKQVPFAYELTYDPVTIDPEGTYLVEAVITENGKVRWVPAELSYVLTNGAPADNVRIRVNQVASVGQRDSQPAAAADVVAALSSDPRFSTLVTLASEAGLVEALTKLNNSTVFAPTNDAFAKLPAGAMDELKGNMSMLTGILLYHVSPEKVTAKTFDGKTELSTLLDGQIIRVKTEGGKVALNESANIEQFDIPAGSNLIQVVSGVLTPFETFGMADKNETLIKVEFACAGGKAMSVVFDNGNRTAAVTFDDQTVTLPQQESGSGIRYANDQYELRGKGEDATLTDVKTGKIVLADCKAQKPASTSEPMLMLNGVLTGVVVYNTREALPPDMTVIVELHEIDAASPTPFTLVASTIFTNAGKQVPLPFELKYDRMKIDPSKLYLTSARLERAGVTLYGTQEGTPVLTKGNPATDVQVTVVQSTLLRTTEPATATVPALSGVLTGTVTYRERMALPDNAVIEVTLADVSKMDVAATIIDTMSFTTAGKQVPFSFELKYDPKIIDPRMSYAVQARITVDGKLVFISTSMNPVLTRGAPVTGVEIVVQPVGKATTPTTPTAPALSGVLTGAVTYLQRMALPDNAVIEVTLADVSRADAPATIIATQTITSAGKQVPFAYELKYDPTAIQPQMTYAVSARILVDGKLRFISTQRYPALTRGAPATGINIVVQPVM